MKITKKSLESAVDEKIISPDQADRLYQYLKQHPTHGPNFDFSNVLYYLGGLIAIGAMTIFMNLGWESFGGWGIFFISLAYAGIGLKLTSVFQSKGYAIPAGICATFVVALTPLAIYGILQGLGLWSFDSTYMEYHKYIKWYWIYMELATVAVGVVLVWKYKYPFLVMPIAVTLWYMSMDIADIIATGGLDFTLRSIVSMYFGLLLIFLAFWVDIRSRKTLDYAFWLYLFGVITFWGGMTTQYSDSELTKFVYFVINILMIGIGVLLVRRVFVVFGAIGCSMYLGYLAHNVFKGSWLFPIALSAIGLGIILLGIQWQKNEKSITAKARSILPAALKELLESKER